MTLNQDFLSKLEYLPPKKVVSILRAEDRPFLTCHWQLKAEIAPVDLFCYLHTRFGPPNGIQNVLRSDSSDNLIHWDWALGFGDGLLFIQGMNFRTEVWVLGQVGIQEKDLAEFVACIKGDFQNFGPGMAQCRNSLELWVEFVNPYERLRKSINVLVQELSYLTIEKVKRIDDPIAFALRSKQTELAREWSEAGRRLHKAFGICFGIRSMLPVCGEAFVNLVLFMLTRPELKAKQKRDLNTKRDAFWAGHRCSRACATRILSWL